MRLVRFSHQGSPTYALAEDETLTPLRAAPWETGGRPEPSHDPVARRGATLLVPTVPSKILGIGRNYKAHAAELGNEVPKEPMVFLKAPSSLVAHRGAVVLPPDAGRVDFEGELAVVIGRRARHVPSGSWRDVVFGFTCGLDVSAREWQKKDGQWWRAKGSDTFCPLGPAIETDADAANLLLETRVDGVVKQSSRTSETIFDLGTLIEWITARMTLEAGDVILTGTPEGVAPLAPGQTVELRIEKIGSLEVRVEAS